MTTSQPISEDTNHRRLRNDVLIYLLGFLALALLEIGRAVRLEKYYAELFPSVSEHMGSALIIAFVIGLMGSAVLGIWPIRAIGAAIRSQVNAQGPLISLQGPLQNYGIALLGTSWFVTSLVVSKLCDPVIWSHKGPEALERVSCYLIGKSALVFIAGLTVGLLAWFFIWVLRFENETTSHVFITRHVSKSWSTAGFLGIAAVVLIIILIAFYRLLTLE